ncbi:MAG: hypothetical protein EHM81_00535 [Chloroflexi bacterium]|nr:MAG: hypothetical protein EHM81_00535 [Chloroflexota bacterium]
MKEIYAGNAALQENPAEVSGEYVSMLGEEYYRIRNFDHMPPFFMSIVSSSDHWMFISSTGGLTAGRANAESALFPYYTDDRIAENQANTGPVSIFQVARGEKTFLWEPFSERYAGLYRLERNLYKNVYGSALVYEEINHDLGLTFRYAWRASEKFGFVKTSWLKNDADACQIQILDGLQNLLPFGATTALQTTFSNLLNAYKRNELELASGLGIFALSSTLTDLAEPSESLKATVAWQLGLENGSFLLSTQQVESFRRGLEPVQETDVRGFRGAYLVCAGLELANGQEKEWHIVADVNQDSSAVAARLQSLQHPAQTLEELRRDIQKNSLDLRKIVASADGLQFSGDRLSAAHHFSNVLFNTMRGGIFAENYTVEKADFLDFIGIRNQTVLHTHADFFASLPPTFHFPLSTPPSADLERLCYEYLPLTFSRRHGDPSRPWNKFSINVKKPDGSQRLDYQGNWRDIFQNWEPLAWSYPEFAEGMICKFLNATTADGYNPYRVTRDGIEWEAPAPNDPWANIGYWGDHQIVYLEKLLEISGKFHPARLQALLTRRIFSHANVPYHIKPYQALLEDPHNTIDFAWPLEKQVEARVKTLGMDGRLLLTADGQVFHVNMLEKLLTLLLAKLSNFVPEGGIWMNTQRPEWNDANNALVGKGLSVVTLGYLRRFIVFFERLVEETPSKFQVTREIGRFFAATGDVLREHAGTLTGSFPEKAGTSDDEQRRQFMDALGQLGSDYRANLYANGFSGDFAPLDKAALLEFLALAQKYVEHSLRANRRPDNLFHAYNILQLGKETASIGHLDEMLEGQVAILSSGLLSGAESLALLQSLKASRLYRADQHSYILYPNRDLPGFLRKNCLSAEQVRDSALIAKLVEQNNRDLIVRDVNGVYHFNGSFRNAQGVKKALAGLQKSADYQPLVEAESETILALFEKTFHHAAFTGRSGTFFAFEGLGSIYWHMVSKLLLAVQEVYLREPLPALLDAYYDIRMGLGFNKSPETYGAFPTDPYSHTPAGQGAKQPGMTGQVKEEILTRLAELGLFVENGVITFKSALLRPAEFTGQPGIFTYIDVTGQEKTLDLPAGALAYTFCQVPVIVRSRADEKIVVRFTDGTSVESAERTLDPATCQHIFQRDNFVQQISWFTKTSGA